MHGVNLKELVEKIRGELEALDQERIAQRREPLFELQSLDLELKVVISESQSAQGGFDLKIVSLGGADSQQKETVQTVRLCYRIASQAKSLGLPGFRSHSSLPVSDGNDDVSAADTE